MYDISILSNQTAKIRIHGRDFNVDLERLKREIPSVYRDYNPEEKIFIVKNISDVEFEPLKVAILENSFQLQLF